MELLTKNEKERLSKNTKTEIREESDIILKKYCKIKDYEAADVLEFLIENIDLAITSINKKKMKEKAKKDRPAREKAIIVYKKNGEIYGEYISSAEFLKTHEGFYQSNISANLNNRTTEYKNLVFKFKGE